MKDVTLSLPQILGADGVRKTIYPEIDGTEKELLRQSAEIIREALDALGLPN